jgi:hypothetical protein
MLSTRTLLLPFFALALLPAACVARNASLASDTSGAEDVAGTESDVESLGSSFIGQDGQSLATQGDTTTVGNPGFWFQPAGCLQVTTDAVNQKASYAFNGCTGPLGLVELTGTVNATWQVAADQLTVDLSSQGFKIDRATIDSWEATAVVTTSGDLRTMTWTGQLSGTTGRGRPFNRTNQKTLTWTIGESCLSVAGQSTGNILGADLQTTITSWQRCADSCPQAGSEIQVVNLDKKDSIDIKYQGGPTAQLNVDGRSETIGLACGD